MAKNSFYRVLTDDELLSLLRTDKNAESEFYRRYKNRVKGFLKQYYLNNLEREDLIQEGMIGLFQAIESFDKSKGVKFSTYSNVCIRNRIMNSLESLIKHKKKIDSKKDMEELVSGETPESNTIRNEISADLKKAVAELPELDQKVLERYLNDKSYKTIAAELDISPKKVDNILMKIKNKLALTLDETGEKTVNRKKKNFSQILKSREDKP